MTAASTRTVLTIGHSSLSYEEFVEFLRVAGADAVADVRSAPYSRQFPHFNREALRDALGADGIAYAYFGDALGGRPSDRRFFCDGVADYEKMARSAAFEAGIERVVEGALRYTIALMCSEHDPLDCHRCLLVGRAVQDRGLRIKHVLSGGRTKDHAAIEDDLLAMAGQNLDQQDFFASRRERLASAYRERARRVAFSASGPSSSEIIAAE